MELPIAIAVIGADPLARAGLAAQLRAEPAAAVVAEASPEGASSLDLRDTVLAWDLGLGAIEPHALWAEVPVLALAADADQARAAIDAGALAVLARTAGGHRLVAAAVAAAAGLLTLDPAFQDALLPDPPIDIDDPDGLLTPREAEVLALLAEGLSNRDVALALTISEHTARFHVQALLGKLEAATRTEAVVRALRMGLLLL